MHEQVAHERNKINFYFKCDHRLDGEHAYGTIDTYK